MAALNEGVIDVVVSDHNPQDVETKRLPFAEAADGALGIETLLGAALRLVHTGDIPLPRLLAALTTSPAKLLGRAAGRLAAGAPADLVLIDPDLPYVLDKRRLKSRSKNSPFDEARLQGAAVLTLVGGRIVFRAPRRDRGCRVTPFETLSWPLLLAALAGGYLLGSIPFGLILTRIAGLGDVRAIGSGISAPPRAAHRAEGAGRRHAARRRAEGHGRRAHRRAVRAGGRARGRSRRLSGAPVPGLARFKGGKGVATFLGVLLALSPLGLLAFAAIWLGLAFTLKYSSLAALAASALTPVVLWGLGQPSVAFLFSCSPPCYGGSTRPTSAGCSTGRKGASGRRAEARRPLRRGGRCSSPMPSVSTGCA